MIIRVVRGKAHTGKQAELVKEIEREDIPWLKSQKGFLSYYFGLDPDGDELVMITLWEDFASLEALGGKYWNRIHIPSAQLSLIEEVYGHHYMVIDHGEEIRRLTRSG